MDFKFTKKVKVVEPGKETVADVPLDLMDYMWLGCATIVFCSTAASLLSCFFPEGTRGGPEDHRAKRRMSPYKVLLLLLMLPILLLRLLWSRLLSPAFHSCRKAYHDALSAVEAQGDAGSSRGVGPSGMAAVQPRDASLGDDRSPTYAPRE